MALVNRWYRILDTLVTHQGLTVEEMRSDLNVSQSTLQRSIEQLNEVLDSDLHIQQMDNKLSLVVYDYERLEEILAGSLRRESDFNSSSKRASYLIKRLIRSTEPLLIDDLAEEIGVSRTTINKDLKQVKSLAHSFHVKVLGKPNRGLEVFGEELNLRLLYIHHVYTYFESDSLLPETHTFLEELARQFHLPKKTQGLLGKVLSITVARLRRGRHLSRPIRYYANELIEADIVHQLVYHMEMVYQLSLSHYEQDFISFPLNTQFIDGLPYRSNHRQDLEELFQDLMKIVQEKLLLSFDEERLYVEMYRHLKALVNRLIFHVQANDIFHGEIQNKYPLAFEMARVTGEELESSFGYELEVSELSYLALYFEMVLRAEQEQTELKKKKIAVVCTTGRGTANMICRQLTRVLGTDIAISQYSEENFNPTDHDDYFAIFTTIPLKLEGGVSPIIQLTNLFDDQWLRDEWHRVNRYHQKNLETITLRFCALPKGQTYLDYLVMMSTRLEKQGLVDADFTNRTLEREARQSTVFGNGIGFPHTINHLDEKTIVMLGVPEGEPEESAYFELIFLVAIPKEVQGQTEADLLELYDDIFRIASDTSLKEELRAVKTEAEFLAVTRRKGVF